MSGVLPTIAFNLATISCACLLFTFVGWLWFQPRSRIGLPADTPAISRFTIYPILGWMIVLIGVNWLRILAVPFRSSAPWLLAILILLPSIWWAIFLFKARPNGNSLRAFFRSRARPAGVVVLVLFLFALIPVDRLTVPSLYQGGSWGYDQENYVHIADQYLDSGMLVSGDVPSGTILSPWIALNESLLKGFFSPKPFGVAKFSARSDSSLSIRSLSLFMRNGGAAMDAAVAVWLDLDEVQAYVLSGYVQYLLLVLAGVWVGLAIGLPLSWGIFLGALASLWPIAVLPSAIDNRDQALALFLILTLLGAGFCRALNPWIRGLALAAVALTYIEILPVAMVPWMAFYLDRRTPWRDSVRSFLTEGFVAFGCCFIFVPWGVNYLGRQIGASTTMVFAMLSDGQFGALSGLAGSFAALGFLSAPFLGLVAMVAGAAMIALQVSGLFLWLRQKRFLGASAFLLLAGLAAYLQQKGMSYGAYKFFTVLFPMAVLLIASCCLAAIGGLPGIHSGRYQQIGRKALLALLVLGLPALGFGAAMRSGFDFDIFWKAQGWNSMLEDPSRVQDGLKLRTNDIIRAREIVRDIDPKDGVLLSNFTTFDMAYFTHFLRQRPFKVTNGIAYNDWDPASVPLNSEMEFVKVGDSIGEVIALCGPPVDLAHPDPLEDIAVVRGKADAVQRGRTFASFNLSSGMEFAFVQRLHSQVPLNVSPSGKKRSGFPFGGGGIAVGVYTANMPNIDRTLRFDVIAGPGVALPLLFKRATTWECFVDGKKVGDWTATRTSSGIQIAIPLPASPAGHLVEIGVEGHVPMKPDVVYRGINDFIRKPIATNEMINFALEDSGR